MEFPRNTGITFKLCIICQTQKDEELVEKPVSRKKNYSIQFGKDLIMEM